MTPACDAACISTGAYADLGWHAANAVRSQALLDGLTSASDAHAMTVQEVISLTLLAVAQLAHAAGTAPEPLFAQALEHARQQQADAAQQLLPGCEPGTANDLPWIKIPQPSMTNERHAAKVLDLLQAAGSVGVTTTDLRHLGVKNPSSVVQRLIRRGHPIRRSNEHYPNQHGGHTRYVLERPPAGRTSGDERVRLLTHPCEPADPEAFPSTTGTPR